MEVGAGGQARTRPHTGRKGMRSVGDKQPGGGGERKAGRSCFDGYGKLAKWTDPWGNFQRPDQTSREKVSDF